MYIYNNKFIVSANIENNLRAWRVAKGVSREDLAKAIDVNYQTIGYIERGDYAPSIRVALKLAEFFETPVESIFSLHKLETNIVTKEVGR